MENPCPGDGDGQHGISSVFDSGAGELTLAAVLSVRRHEGVENRAADGADHWSTDQHCQW